ncbi:MAG: RNA polymerase sigma factor RpoH [Nevskiaceae bacterium]|nr:MAG: RNA polymerase sigma factor RpoH [Nevskiaceae bacterium]TBR73159.1 MAG: RNA polymerase sigma factor RpoH [Nevskiaceae bacterium]
MTTAALALRPSYLPMPLAGSLDAYLQSLSHIPVLSPAEETQLARDLRDHDDLKAAQRLVLSNLRFVVHIARGYQGYGLPLADLIQEGNIGLMKAIKRFDPEVGVRLISFAVHWIKAEIHEYVLANWRIVKVATTKAQRKLFFNLRRAKQRLGWLHHDEVVAVAKDLNVKPEEVLRMESRLSGRDVSFSAGPADDDTAYMPEDYLAADDDPGATLEAADWNHQVEGRMQAALQQLDDRSRDIVTRRWLSRDGGKAGLKELGEEYGVSAERVRQIEAAAMKKMRTTMALEQLDTTAA